MVALKLLTDRTCQSFSLVMVFRGAYDSKAAGVADGAGELGVPNPLHTALHHRHCDASVKASVC